MLAAPARGPATAADNALTGAVALSIALAAIVTVAPDLGLRTPTGRGVFDWLGGTAAVLASAVALTRFRRSPSPANRALSIALGALASTTLLLVAAPSVLALSDWSLLAAARAVGGLLCAALLARAAFAARSPVTGWRLVAGAAALAVSAGGVGALIGAAGPGVTAAGIPAGARGLIHVLSYPAPFVLIQIASAVLFAAAGWGLALGGRGLIARLEGALPAFERRRGIADRAAAAVLLERRRIARELHDGAAQGLAFIVSQSRRLARMFPDERAAADIGSAAEHALDQFRLAIYALQRPVTRALGAAVEERAYELAQRAGLKLRLDVAAEIASSAEVEHAVISILQEAISNVARHADATTVAISLHTRGDTLVVRISDDGRGFEPAEPNSSPIGGFGLSSMHERARELGGRLSLTSTPDGGTTIEVALR